MKGIFILLGLAFLAYADTCGGNCPLNDCPKDTCSCGYSSNVIDIAYWCSQFQGWSQSCCKCIAPNISNGNANTESYNSYGSRQIGVWQINSTNWESCNDGNPPCSPTSNLNCAKKIWAWGGNSWKYWPACSACGCCNSSDERDKLILELRAQMKEIEDQARLVEELAAKNRGLRYDSQV
ncbi:unnamed protein product [Blepharisma stoltei]|uniref:Transglycosylase SLT domain-containing protein n=1 Tax=Blepharisma stoltei TaxID=1481888 RepID=A0AAU9IXF8_9CILI|nr:unnamed protein product [Blepharisma stoltei]